jgi:RNA polymerase sigma-70 factor (ECF subfamily)
MQEVIRAILSGQTDRFGEIYDLHMPLVASVLRKVGRFPRSELDYHVNGVFIRIYEALPQFRNRSKFSTWVYSITLRYAWREGAKYRRESARKTELDEETPALPPDGAGPDDALLAEELLDALPMKLRAAAVLYYCEGLSMEEIAMAEDISEGAAKNRLFQAREKMKQWLREKGVNDEIEI